jgi:hypothetical protein
MAIVTKSRFIFGCHLSKLCLTALNTIQDGCHCSIALQHIHFSFTNFWPFVIQSFSNTSRGSAGFWIDFQISQNIHMLNEFKLKPIYAIWWNICLASACIWEALDHKRSEVCKREMNMLKCNADIKISHDSHYVPTHKRNDSFSNTSRGSAGFWIDFQISQNIHMLNEFKLKPIYAIWWNICFMQWQPSWMVFRAIRKGNPFLRKVWRYQRGNRKP